MVEGSGKTGSNELRPHIVEGGLHVDARGTVSFVNDFDFTGVDRFYTIRAHRPQELRGWVGHQRDHKWFFPAEGTILIAVVKPDRWDCPSSDLAVDRFVLCAAKPQVLCVPPGYATGSVNLSDDAILMIFSSGKIEDAKADDHRFAVSTWPIIE
jgi:dTDP-4-dehydrorhamnose 3,5-epimerase